MTRDPDRRTTVDIDRFIAETQFSGYQRVVLPDGRVIPGTDRKPAADRIFQTSLTGKSVLDVGCYYGSFLHEAIRRGASRAVGIEADPERYRIASVLAQLWEGKIQIHEGLLEGVELSEQFDVVIFLNVLHHVQDPIGVMRKLASLCRGTLIVEFRQPHDPQFILECFRRRRETGSPRHSLIRRGSRRLGTAVGTRLVEEVTSRLPIIGVGSIAYHRSYFFSKRAFQNAFQVHNKLFTSVEFHASTSRGQTLAMCACQGNLR